MGLTHEKKNEENVAFVNNLPIHLRELQWSINENKNIVRSNLIREYGIKSEEFSWEKQYEGKYAYDYLVDQAMNGLVSIKIKQQLGQEAGIINEVDYESFYKEWIETNASREKEDLVYGPITYDEGNYYSYKMNNLELKLRNYIVDHKINPTEEEIKEIYDKNKSYFLNEPLEKVRNNIILLIAQQYYDNEIKQLIAKAQVKYTNQKGIESILREEGIIQ